MNPLFRIDFSISDSLKIVRKSVLIYETIIKSQYQDILAVTELRQNFWYMTFKLHKMMGLLSKLRSNGI